MFQKATLRWHILLIILLSGIPGVAIMGYNAWVEENRLRARSIEDAAAAARRMVIEQRNLNAESERLLRRLAAMPEFERGDLAACDRQIARLIEFARPYSSFGLATLDGASACSVVPRQFRSSIAQRPYFQEALKTGGTFHGTYQVGAATGKAAVAVSTPIYNGQHMAGVAFALVPVTWYSGLAEELHIPTGFTMTVVDRGLTILAQIPEYPGRPQSGRNIAKHPIAAVLQGGAMEGVAQMPGLDDDGQYLAAFARLPGTGVQDAGYVFVSAPQSEVFAASRAALERNVIALFMVIVTVILAASVGTERLVLRHVDKLVKMSRRLRAGDMTARVSQRGGSREIMQLSQTFDEMAAALSEREAALIDKNHELERAVDKLRRAREETERAERSALDYAEQLRAMSRRLMEVQESDQRSLAGELHDSVSSNLAVVGLELRTIEEELPPELSQEIGARLTDCIDLVKTTMECTRDISADLYSSILDHAGLGPALEDLGHKFARRMRLAIDVKLLDLGERAPVPVEVALFRIAKEALTNCAKHAHAGHAGVELRFEEGSAVLVISDDGEGFDPARVVGPVSGPSAGLHGGLGLLSMRERAEAIGGEFTVASNPGQGTRITVRAPLAKQESEQRSARVKLES